MIKQVTRVVCGFPGVGKSYAFEHQKELGATITDSDSSIFSKIKKEDGSLEQNPDFPTNYINHIRTLIATQNYNYILVSSHHTVREALKEAQIPYTIVYPMMDQKSQYIQKYKDRGSPEAFINLLDEKFIEFVKDCCHDSYPHTHVILEDNQTLWDWIQEDFKNMKMLMEQYSKSEKTDS